MKTFMQFTWELPQTLLGLLVVTVLKMFNQVSYVTYSSDGWVQVWVRMDIGVSLGRYVITRRFPYWKTLAHEYGHCRQSQYLGWLYLPVVGLPSVVMNILIRLHILKKENYYKRWPESWANKLGGISG